MPIWLRNYTFREIKEFYEQENSRAKESNTNKTKKILGPDIDPTYKSRASKK